MFYDIYLYTLCYYICCLLWRMYEMHPALFLKTGCYRVALRGLSKVPLVRENPLRIQEEGSIGIPRPKSFTDSSTQGPPYTLQRRLPACPFQVR